MLYPPSRRIVFFLPRAAPDPGASQFLVQWSSEGELSFQASTDDVESALGRLEALVEIFTGNPRLLEAAVRGDEAAIRAAGVEYLGIVHPSSPAPLCEIE